MSALNENAITRLATVASIDMNNAAANLLYSVPTGKSAIIAHFVIRNASISLDTATYSVGWNAATYDDVFADTGAAALTSSTVYELLSADSGATVGLTTEGLYLMVNTPQGAAATMDIDVFGYLI